MSTKSLAAEVLQVIRGELDDCERAINRDDKRSALNELDDAVRKLKRVADQLN